MTRSTTELFRHTLGKIFVSFYFPYPCSSEASFLASLEADIKGGHYNISISIFLQTFDIRWGRPFFFPSLPFYLYFSLLFLFSWFLINSQRRESNQQQLRYLAYNEFTDPPRITGLIYSVPGKWILLLCQFRRTHEPKRVECGSCSESSSRCRHIGLKWLCIQFKCGSKRARSCRPETG